jgi:hypothetical protein
MYGRSYRLVADGVYLDNNIRNAGGMRVLFKDYTGQRPLYLTSRLDEVINGRSWEMSVAMALSGHRGVYTGVISDATDDSVNFGRIRGLAEKRDVFSSVKTSADVPFVKR